MEEQTSKATTDALCETSWLAGLHHYDYIQSYRFYPDGTGEVAFGYAQAMRFESKFTYSVTDAERLTLEVKRPGELHEVRFRIERGTFPIEYATLFADSEENDQPEYSHVAFARLHLEPDPMEKWVDPFEYGMPYYGHIQWPDFEEEESEHP